MKFLTRYEEHVLLTVLRLKDNAYLVTMRKLLKQYTGQNQYFGTLYVTLKRLKKDGYLKTEIGESAARRGGRAIQYYRLTKQGVDALKQVQSLNKVMWMDFKNMIADIKE